MPRKYGKKASAKVKRAMHERKRGTLKSGRSGKTVKTFESGENGESGCVLDFTSRGGLLVSQRSKSLARPRCAT